MLARLCLKLGYPSVDSMLEDMTSQDLSYWVAVDNWRTIGGDDQILEAIAMLTTMVAAGHGAKGVKPDNFVPWQYEEPKETPPEVFASAMGGSAKKIVAEIEELEEWKRNQNGNSRDS